MRTLLMSLLDTFTTLALCTAALNSGGWSELNTIGQSMLSSGWWYTLCGYRRGSPIRPCCIHKRTVSFFSKLYNSEQSVAHELEESFLHKLPKLTRQSAEMLDRALSLAELYTALQGCVGCAQGKLGGRKAFTELSKGCPHALAEKGDLTDLKSWRPVSLLCMDYKLLSKSLAARLGKVMEQVVHLDQTYCVPELFTLTGPRDGEYQSGSAVTLSCHLSPELSAVTMEIRWFKGTDCVCLYKDRQVTKGRGYQGRVSLFTQELQRGNVSLQIRDYRESDTGDYLCQVTNGDTTEECTVGVWRFQGNQEIQRLVEKCGNRFHCLNIKERGDGSQTSELLEKIEKMVERNREEFYSSEIYLETESQIRAMETKIMKEREEKRVMVETEIKEKLEKEVQNSLRRIEGVVQEHEGEIKQLNTRTTELEKRMKEERDEEKRRELERELERELGRRTEMEKKVKRLKENTEKERREIEERHRQEMEEIRELYDGEARMEAERNLMKILLPELQRNILASKSKMQEEFSRQMEEKNRELETLRQRLLEVTEIHSLRKEVYETAVMTIAETERRGTSSEPAPQGGEESGGVLKWLFRRKDLSEKPGGGVVDNVIFGECLVEILQCSMEAGECLLEFLQCIVEAGECLVEILQCSVDAGECLVEMLQCSMEAGECLVELLQCNVEAGECLVEILQCSMEAGECLVELLQCSVEAGECVVEFLQCSVVAGECLVEILQCSMEAGECLLEFLQCIVEAGECLVEMLQCSVEAGEFLVELMQCSMEAGECVVEFLQCSVVAGECLVEILQCSMEAGECLLEFLQCIVEAGECLVEILQCSVDAGECLVEMLQCSMEAGECLVELLQCNVEAGECVVEILQCSMEAGECLVELLQCSVEAEESLVEYMRCSVEAGECLVELLQCSVEARECLVEMLQCSVEAGECLVEILQCSVEAEECLVELLQCSVEAGECLVEYMQCSVEAEESLVEYMRCSVEAGECLVELLQCSVEAGGCLVEMLQCSVEAGGCLVEMLQCSVEAGECLVELLRCSVEAGECLVEILQCSVEAEECLVELLQCSVEAGGCLVEMLQCSVEAGGCVMVECVQWQWESWRMFWCESPAVQCGQALSNVWRSLLCKLWSGTS
ncbi:hypothetical protein NFI96_009553 [Prochilodus magdalenae]|nr:hypothetical protein NFI96_009553 [Prochilodus magdalenae]